MVGHINDLISFCESCLQAFQNRSAAKLLNIFAVRSSAYSTILNRNCNLIIFCLIFAAQIKMRDITKQNKTFFIIKHACWDNWANLFEKDKEESDSMWLFWNLIFELGVEQMYLIDSFGFTCCIRWLFREYADNSQYRIHEAKRKHRMNFIDFGNKYTKLIHFISFS